MKKNKKGAASEKFNLSEKLRTSLIIAFITASVLVILGGKTLLPQSKAQENSSAETVAAPAAQFCNSTSISLPAGGVDGRGNPYPSSVNVSGMSGVVSSVSVTLNNLQHFWASDLDILLVSPDGRKFVVMSDIGGADGFDNPATITLSDAGATDLANAPVPIPSGTYRPTNLESGDAFPLSAPSAPYNEPAPAGNAAFASVFNNANPNGTWRLYVLDDSSGAGGSMAGGWCLNITTAAPAPGALQFGASNYNAVAPNTASVIVNRASGGLGAVTVDYQTSNGTATGGAACAAGVDYVSTGGTLSFADGELSKTFAVQLCPDAAPEPNETINLTLSNPTGGATLGSPATAAITIYTSGTAPCDMTWRNYAVTARAFDNRNQMVTSAPINVSILPLNPAPLPIGRPELTNPVDGAAFPAPANITLEALPAPTHRTIVRVEFYNGTTLVGTDMTAPYSFTLNNLSKGRYTFFVKSVADNDAESISQVVDVSVGLARRRGSLDFGGESEFDVFDTSVFRPDK